MADQVELAHMSSLAAAPATMNNVAVNFTRYAHVLLHEVLTSQHNTINPVPKRCNYRFFYALVYPVFLLLLSVFG